MESSDQESNVVLTRAELELLRGLVRAKIEAVLVHSAEYFALEDLAHKLETALTPEP